ncbi:hypothetical protein [uncultured Draconibacterium sp.]|uniref:nuclear transport factor 2 family protein n=1 Tax=uncultured Draconibacterium sp. TaxID=1573823 RepID=UPI003217A24B
MTNTEIAQSFLTFVIAGKIREAFDRFIAPEFIHHNQYFKGDRQSLQQAMQEDYNDNPNKSIEIKKVYTDKETVITHSLVLREHLEIAVIHIFRFEGNKVVESWDLGQLIDKDSPNQNGLF